MHLADPAVLVGYAALGALLGICSFLFIRSVYGREDLFDRMKGGYYARHMAGMALVGVIIYSLLALHGHYYALPFTGAWRSGSMPASSSRSSTTGT